MLTIVNDRHLATTFSKFFKMVLLQAIDQRWKEHLYYVDRLKEGINLRAFGQKDPLIEYKKEAFKAFENLHSVIKTDAVEKMMKVQLVAPDAQAALEEMQEQLQNQSVQLDELDYQGPEEDTGISFANNSSGRASAEPASTQKIKMVVGPGEGDSQRMNREERRKMKKK
jgi:preprotein translocase subunit SecA